MVPGAVNMLTPARDPIEADHYVYALSNEAANTCVSPCPTWRRKASEEVSPRGRRRYRHIDNISPRRARQGRGSSVLHAEA